MSLYSYAYTSWTREYMSRSVGDIRELDVETRYPETPWGLMSELISIMLSEVELQVVFWLGPEVRLVLAHTASTTHRGRIVAMLYVVLIHEHRGSSPGIIGEYQLTQRVTLLTLEDLNPPDSWLA